MIGVLFLLALLANPSQSWLLEASHTSIQVGVTKDVTITCKYDDNDLGKAPIKNVLRIVIKRLKDDKTVSTYTIRIGFTKPEVDPKSANPDLSVKGHIDEAKGSFLSLTWSKPSQDAVGKYQCEVQGYSKDDTFINLNTISPVTVNDGSSCLCTQLSKPLLDLKKRFEESQKESPVTQSVVDELMKIFLPSLNQMLNGFKTDFDNELDLLEKKVALIKTGSGKSESKGIKWPGGQYALLNTEDGCPTSTKAGWQAGYTKFFAYPSNGLTNQDELSDPNHMAGPVISKAKNDISFTLRTCTRDPDSHVTLWPKGSYCIQRDGGRCPDWFTKGHIRMTAANTYRHIERKNAPDKGTHNLSDFTLYFCCRKDQDHDVPMTLPAEHPFLLYRYNRKCQQVKGTKVSDEWFVVDTGVRPTYSYTDRSTGTTPDARVTPLRMYLCYYSPLA